MKIENVIGIAILASVAIGLFITIALEAGVLAALCVFSISAALSSLIMFATNLISR